MRVAPIASLVLIAALAQPAAADDEPVAITKQGKAGQEMNVARYAQWDSQCQARGLPARFDCSSTEQRSGRRPPGAGARIDSTSLSRNGGIRV